MRRPALGFTLLEVLVAFTMLAVLLGVLMQVFSDGMRNAVEGEDRARAVMLAEALLVQAGLPSADASFPPREEEGEFDDGRFRWRTSVQPFDVPPAEGAASQPVPILSHTMVQVVATVEWTSWGRPRDVTLTTWRVGRKQP